MLELGSRAPIAIKWPAAVLVTFRISMEMRSGARAAPGWLAIY